MVAASARTDAPGRRALESLCQQYWPPLYAFARRRGLDPESALDATQGFFAGLLDGPTLGRADATRGRFRTYLLGCFSNFLASEHRAAKRQKRGGGERIMSIDARDAEARHGPELEDRSEPSDEFDRRWAIAVLDRAMERLREEYEQRGRGELLDSLRGALQGRAPGLDPGAASRLGLSEGAARVAVHRMRKRFAQILIEEVGQTVGDDADVADEIRALRAAFSA
ncbi:MAG: sigma factor [Planctomycetota bacterium]